MLLHPDRMQTNLLHQIVFIYMHTHSYHVFNIINIPKSNIRHSSSMSVTSLVVYSTLYWLALPLIESNEHCLVPFRIPALILARGGSKGIPLKNLAKVGNKTLLGNAIERLLHFGQFDSIWVSTDHPDIAAEAKRYAVNVHWRSEESATDTATSIDSVQEFLRYHSNIEWLALVQCTSVFIETNYLAEATRLANLPDVDCVFAAWWSHKLRWTSIGDQLKPLNFDPKHRPRRQDWGGELIESGMFYIAKRELLEAGVFQNDRCKVVEIHSKHSIEIDNVQDLLLVNYLINVIL